MTALSRWLSRLQLSPRSERMIAETTADWQHEVAGATTITSAVLAHVRGTIALMRLCGTVIAESAMPALHPAWLIRLLVWFGIESLFAARNRYAFLILGARFAVPFAILFGPAARRSPFVGFAIAQILASIYVAVALPGLSMSLMLQATLASILAGAVADRVRIDLRREVLTAKLAVLLFVMWYVALELAVGLRRNGVVELTIERALWTWFMLALGATWWWIVKAQESRAWWAQLQLWLEHRGRTLR